ncbi:MAG: HIT domain-containing protein [Nocardioidaceae bacterium]
MTEPDRALREEDCLFCRISSGEIQADRVAESEHALAFRDLNPQAPTHVLVVPKVHSATLPDLALSHPGVAIEVLTLARQVAHAEDIEGGNRLVCNNGAGAQQTVFHAHVHVLGGRTFSWPPG